VVTLKRLEAGALVFTTAMWSRKAEEMCRNRQVAAVFHWPALGRQVRIEGRGEVAERTLGEELFAARPRAHQLQALVSRQGETIERLDPLREGLECLRAEMADRPIECPPDWGAVRIAPTGSSSGRKPPTASTSAASTRSTGAGGASPTSPRSLGEA
jgi:pyridoxamine 5'-phosphate oxidase